MESFSYSYIQRVDIVPARPIEPNCLVVVIFIHCPLRNHRFVNVDFFHVLVVSIRVFRSCGGRDFFPVVGLRFILIAIAGVFISFLRFIRQFGVGHDAEVDLAKALMSGR